MKNFIKDNWFKILAAIILLFGLGNHPYTYYQFTRWAILIIGAYSAYLAYKNKDEVWAWILGIVAVLFNPIAPFYLSKGTWQFFDFIAAALFIISTFKSKSNAETK